MHGGRREGDCLRRKNRLMLSASSRAVTTTVTAADSRGASPNYFFKDGRKIRVGDCALFKSPHESAPCIGIIRWLKPDTENSFRFGLNRLYRPGDIKVENNTAPETAPNEIFYSFQRDEIPAASILHPCKVAFLPRGAELPSGVSSFVCRKVYDHRKKCLWYLTDQDHLHDWQKEVDRLLRSTRREMHATIQQQRGSRSPKPVCDTAKASPAKRNSDALQSNDSQAKGKKRDRGDPLSDYIKRERILRTAVGDPWFLRSESMLKSEVAKITDKGRLIDSRAVERLVQLMQPEKSEGKLDLVCRSMLVGIIAATDRFDFLSQFVQLKGLPVLDEWLHEVHKGKANSPKDTDKSVEDYILVILRALDKLPVNLNALQSCNIGKSVNYLRSHKNLEIQRKVRILVDAWKKRVEVEMNRKNTKSDLAQHVAWSSTIRNEVSHSGSRHTVSSSEAAIRSSAVPLSSSKSASLKVIPGENYMKSVPASLGMRKASASTNSVCKDVQIKISAGGGGGGGEPQASEKEEKSSSSSHSHCNSPCSNDVLKHFIPSSEEDARSSTSGSRGANKMTSGASRHKKHSNGVQGTTASGILRENGYCRNSSSTNLSSDKLSKSILAPESKIDTSNMDGNNHKFIVKISNRGRSLAQSGNEVCKESSSCRTSTASLLVQLEKNELVGACARDQGNASKTNERHSSPVEAPEKLQSHNVSDRRSTHTAVNPLALADLDGTSDPSDKESNKHSDMLSEDVSLAGDTCSKTSEKVQGLVGDATIGQSRSFGVVVSPGDGGDVDTKKEAGEKENCDQYLDTHHIVNASLAGDKLGDGFPNMVEQRDPLELQSGCSSCSEGSWNRSTKELDNRILSVKKLTNMGGKVEPISINMVQTKVLSVVSEAKANINDDKPDSAKTIDPVSDVNVLAERKSVERTRDPSVQHELSGLGSSGSDLKIKCDSDSLDSKGALVSTVEELEHINTSSLKVISPIMEQKDEHGSPIPHVSPPGSSVEDKLPLDLNEGIHTDDVEHGEPILSPSSTCVLISSASLLNVSVSSASVGIPTLIAVSAATKVSIIPTEDPLPSKSEPGWRGSAATSAFRPAEPRKVADMPVDSNSSHSAAAASFKQDKPHLDIDLNVADERILQVDGCHNCGQEMEPNYDRKDSFASCRFVGGLDFDLNKVDESLDLGLQSPSNIQRFESSALPDRSIISTELMIRDIGVRRGFDLNDGPSVDEVIVDTPSSNPHAYGNIALQPSFGPRMTSMTIGNYPSSFSPGIAYSSPRTPSTFPYRGAHHLPIFGIGGGHPGVSSGPTSSPSYCPDVYRSMWSSSPAMNFSTTPIHYPSFPVGPSFPLPTPTMSSGSTLYIDSLLGGRLAEPTQLVGGAPAISFQYPRPAVTIPDVYNNGAVESNWRQGRQLLDLNSGPQNPEGMHNASIVTSRQLPALSSNSLVEEQSRLYHAPAGGSKRKEPERGWGFR